MSYQTRVGANFKSPEAGLLFARAEPAFDVVAGEGDLQHAQKFDALGTLLTKYFISFVSRLRVTISQYLRSVG